MPSNKKQTPAADLSLLLKELKKAEVDFILVGGVAAVAQGAPISTTDFRRNFTVGTRQIDINRVPVKNPALKLFLFITHTS